MDALSAFDRDTSSCTVDKPLFTLRHPYAAPRRYDITGIGINLWLIHPHFIPGELEYSRGGTRDESSLVCKHLSAMGLFSYPLLPIPSPLSIPRDGSNPRSTNLYPTPSVFGYPYRDSNSGLIEGLCAMKDRNPTLRPLSAVLSIFHLYYHISGIRNPFFSRNSGSLLTTSRYDPRMERIPWNDGYLLTRILAPRWRGEN